MAGNSRVVDCLMLDSEHEFAALAVLGLSFFGSFYAFIRHADCEGEGP